jgi:hypothetical protein
MQGRKITPRDGRRKTVHELQFSERIPKDNFYRRLREILDLQSIYRDTRDLYGRTSNPSIDPAVFRSGPVYRQKQMLKRIGMKIPPTTLTNNDNAACKSL